MAGLKAGITELGGAHLAVCRDNLPELIPAQIAMILDSMRQRRDFRRWRRRWDRFQKFQFHKIFHEGFKVSNSRIPISLKGNASGFASEGTVIIEIEEVCPGTNVLASGGEFRDNTGKVVKRLRVAIRSPAILELAPLRDFPGSAFVFRVGLDPLKDFSIAFAFGNFSFEGFGVDASEVKNVLIKGTVEMKFTILANDRGATFVEHARKDGVTAETGAHAPGRTLSEIRGVDSGGAHVVCFRLLRFILEIVWQRKRSQILD
jgi:hypothetical protein